MVVTMFDKNGNGKIDREERPEVREFLQSSGMLKGISDGL
jgi:hypothetical protein